MTLNAVGVAGSRCLLSQGIFWTTDLADVREGDRVLISSPFGAHYYRLTGFEEDDSLSLAWLDLVDDPPSSSEPPRGER